MYLESTGNLGLLHTYIYVDDYFGLKREEQSENITLRITFSAIQRGEKQQLYCIRDSQKELH